MQHILNMVYLSVAALFLGEMALGLLPEGGMKKFCKLVLGLLVVFMVLGILQPGELPELSVPQSDPAQSSSSAQDTGSYEEFILDVYQKEMENKNN